MPLKVNSFLHYGLLISCLFIPLRIRATVKALNYLVIAKIRSMNKMVNHMSIKLCGLNCDRQLNLQCFNFCGHTNPSYFKDAFHMFTSFS